jgi:LemA protein
VLLGLSAVFVVVALIVVLSWRSTYNDLNNGINTVYEKADNVGATVKRRADLIPNLVAVVKGYAEHEKGTFTAVTEARAKVGQVNINAAATDPEQMRKFAEAQGELSSAISRLLLVQEKYPDLKANENFKDLQSQLEGTENRINEARQRYNKAVKDYNTLCGGFFSQLVASFHNFKKAERLEVSETDKTTPKVEF